MRVVNDYRSKNCDVTSLHYFLKYLVYLLIKVRLSVILYLSTVSYFRTSLDCVSFSTWHNIYGNLAP